jgi:acyl-CoA oxidase
MLQDGFFSTQQISILQNKLTGLLAELRPNAVALVDAFDYPDKVLDSCLGRYDGQVYQALYEYAKNSPLNNKEVSSIFIYVLYLKIFVKHMYCDLAIIYHIERGV